MKPSRKGAALVAIVTVMALGEARTTATVVRRRHPVPAVPGTRAFFALDHPTAVVLLAAVGIAALADSTLEAGVAARRPPHPAGP
jgi:hypothetical protein